MDDKSLLLEIYQKISKLEEKLEGYTALKDKLDRVCERTSNIDTEFCAFKKLFWLVAGTVVANIIGIVFLAVQKVMS